MNLSNSECSSGCESGWTMYFDQYSNSHQEDQYNRIDEEETLRNKGRYINDDYIQEKEEEDEDLSMVSDASSGPPHLHEDEDFYARNEHISYISDQTKVKQKTKKGGKTEEDKSHLDDTASSYVGDFPKEKSSFSKHFSFLKTSVEGKGASEKPAGGIQGRSANN